MSPEERLMETLGHLSSRMLQFHSQIQDLSKLNKQLSEFNRIFASFLLSLQLTSTGVSIQCVQPELPTFQIYSQAVDAKQKDEITIQPPELASQIMERAVTEPPNLTTLTPQFNSKPSCRSKKSNIYVKSQTNIPLAISVSQTKREQAASAAVKKVTYSLPLHMRTPGFLNEVEAIIRFLLRSPSGEYINDILTGSGVEKHRVMQYLNLLIRSNDVVKVSKKGLLYQLNPEKYHF